MDRKRLRSTSATLGQHRVARGVPGVSLIALKLSMSTLRTALCESVAAGLGEFALELLLKAPPVDQAGELVVLGEVAQAVLVALLLGDVACNHRDGHDLVVGVPNGRDRQRDHDRAAVLSHPFGLELVDGLAGEHTPQDLGLFALAVRRLDHRDGAADRLLGDVAVQSLGGPVPARDRRVLRIGDDRVVGGVDHVAEELAGRALGLAEPRGALSLQVLADLPADQHQQPLQPFVEVAVLGTDQLDRAQGSVRALDGEYEPAPF